MTTRVAATLAALALVVVGCGSLVPPGQRISVLTGVDPNSCFAGGETGHAGLLTPDLEFGTRFDGVPVMWPLGFTGVRHPAGVEVLDGAGNVVARTGRVYYIAIGPVTGKANMFDTGGAYAAAATCGSGDFVDCGPPPGSGEAIPGRGLCSLVQPPPPSPAPTEDPEVLRKADRAAYLKAERAALTSKRALDKTPDEPHSRAGPGGLPPPGEDRPEIPHFLGAYPGGASGHGA